MNETIQPIGPGEHGHDPLRSEAIPEAATKTLLMVGLLMLLGFMRLNATVTRRFKRGKLTPMPTALKYGGWR